MLKTLALLAFIGSSRADSVQHFYALGDAEALRAVCSSVETVYEDLLCRYRLYPLTSDAALLADLPTELDDASPREMAILAGLWGYRATSGSIFGKIRSGRHANRWLSAAKTRASDEPFVLLIEGQSFLFRPAIFGGDNHRALEIFRELQRTLDGAGTSDITRLEADLWVWFALTRLEDPAARIVRESIERRNPPPLFANFLANPPS